jgi:hypothetical protein
MLMAGSAVLTFSGVAHAQSVTGHGSAVFTTLRECAPEAGSVCDGMQAPITQSNLSGGAGTEANATFTGTGVGAGSTAFGSVHFNGIGLPQIAASASAVGNVRVNSNVYFYQSYTYTGADPIDFSLVGDIHIDDSTTDNSTDPDFGGTFENGAIVFAGVTVWDAASFYQFTDAVSFADLNNSWEFSAACEDDAGVLASGSFGTGLPGGEQSFGFSTQSCSGGGALQLHTGDQFVVAGIMQFPVNRGGSIDAMHTFTVNLDPALGSETIAALRSNLAFTPTPEPATWASMMLGFGAIGLGLRRRRLLRTA